VGLIAELCTVTEAYTTWSITGQQNVWMGKLLQEQVKMWAASSLLQLSLILDVVSEEFKWLLQLCGQIIE